MLHPPPVHPCRRRSSPGRLPALPRPLLRLLLLLLTVAAAAGFLAPPASAAITSLSLERIPGGVRITATGEPGSYFVLQSSASLEEFAPVSIDLAAGGAFWEFDTGDLPGHFWIVRQISLSAPEDTDGDGMDDVWELARQLNPLDPADAAAVPPGETATNLQIYLNVWQRKIPDDEVFSRETSVFNAGSAFGSADAIGREVAVYNFGSPPGGTHDAIGREVSVFNGERVPPTDFGEAISREVTAYNFGSPPGGIHDAIGREVSVFNGERVPPTELGEAISREVTTYNFGSPSAAVEAISREVTVLNFLDPGPP